MQPKREPFEAEGSVICSLIIVHKYQLFDITGLWEKKWVYNLEKNEDADRIPASSQKWLRKCLQKWFFITWEEGQLVLKESHKPVLSNKVDKDTSNRGDLQMIVN